ncbi:MAG TPA: hypothetical protein VM029_19785, partial [Opitutaceae bacterium]|nr:hypothetical protein [Opitutaceae bacterium]
MKKIIRSIVFALAAAGLVPAAWAGSFASTEVAISDINVGSQFPEVAVYGGIIHVVFVGYGTGSQGDIYYARSTNNGGSFTVPIILSGTTGNDRPQVTAGPNGVFVAWNSNNDTGAVYVRRSADGGANFAAAFVAGGVEGGSFYSRLTSLFTDTSGNVHIGYYDNSATGGAAGMIMHRMICSGTSLGADTAVTGQLIDGDADNEQPRMGQAGGKLYVVFRSSRNGNPQSGWPPYSIQMQTGTIGGCAATWSYPARRLAGGLPLNYGSTWRPEVVGEASGNVHVAWWENALGANVFYR